MLQLHPCNNEMSTLLNHLKNKSGELILFGASKCGMDYFKLFQEQGIHIKYFADDNQQKQKELLFGLPVISLKEAVSKEGTIVIASYGPEKLLTRLRSISPEAAARAVLVDFYLYEGGLDYYRYFEDHYEQLNDVSSLLSDEKSNKVLTHLLQYKISRKRQLIEDIREDPSLQYFDPSLIKTTPHEVFVDAGAYAGDTVEAFLKKADDKYDRIIALEPDDINFRKLVEKYGSRRNINCYPVGVAEKDGEVHFSASGDWTSSVDTEGDITIPVRSIDSLLDGSPVTFLKADIEGMEKEMLRGAEHSIRRYRPKIAIAVYHKKEDIFEIPLMLHKYNPEYKFYLRHYTEMPIDSVLYAIP